jgi:hypothetical protein
VDNNVIKFVSNCHVECFTMQPRVTNSAMGVRNNAIKC